MSVSPTTLKQTIRKQILALREQQPDTRAARSSATITERLLQLPEYRQATAVLGYMNIRAEYASELWVARALAEGKRVALPRVNHHANQLDLYWVDDLENQLVAGLWGIREPVVERCERLKSLNEVEFALLPGAAFTRRGERLGYGGGYYDKLLAHLNGGNETRRFTLAAAAFSLQIVADIPQESTDVRVEWIVTEQETIACSI